MFHHFFGVLLPFRGNSRCWTCSPPQSANPYESPHCQKWEKSISKRRNSSSKWSSETMSDIFQEEGASESHLDQQSHLPLIVLLITWFLFINVKIKPNEQGLCTASKRVFVYTRQSDVLGMSVVWSCTSPLQLCFQSELWACCWETSDTIFFWVTSQLWLSGTSQR